VKLGSPIAGVILSAGASSRMGTPKALLQFHGETFLDRLIRLFSEAGVAPIVVLGHHAEQIRAGIQRSVEATFVMNPDPERGMLSSLQCALAAIPEKTEAVMFLPVDHPNLEADTLRKLIAKFNSDQPPVTVPTFQDKHGHPVLISRAPIAELLALPSTAQASDVIHRYRSQTAYIAVDDAAVTTDIDDPATYAALLSNQQPETRNQQPPTSHLP
jgi:molybdenum cofactor cytidylyltransferase